MNYAAIRMFWTFVIAVVIAFAAHLFFGSVIASGADDWKREAALRDVFSGYAHEITGHVFVPSSCHDLSVRTKDVDANTTALILETWEQPYAPDCNKNSEPRAFRASVVAPEDVNLIAFLDGELLTVRMISQ